MQPVKCLACDKVSTGNEDWVESLDLFASQFEDSAFHFIHPSIPRERAITLGVKPLLDALVGGLEDENFMAGLDYGQHEDLCDRLQSILNKCPADYSILNEFLQNADDARATEIVFILDHRKFSADKLFPSRHKKWKDLQETPALLVVNNSKFTEDDIQGIAKLGRGGKRNASDTIGRFGIGFNVAYHVTDCPSFVTFSEKGEPENFCVFDPTCSFANTTKKAPGKKWKISAKAVADLPGQFKPYLLNSITGQVLESFEKEHVVFRLPLTRNHISQRISRHLRGGKEGQMRLGTTCFNVNDVIRLFRDMEHFAHDSLLFLNHVRKISVIEIRADDQVCKHFSTHMVRSDDVRKMCTKFASDVKQITKGIMEPKVLSIIYETKVVHIKGESELSEHSEETQEWLVSKRYSPISLVKNKEDELSSKNDATQWNNMRPIGGIAAAMNTEDMEGKLFCFLPTPIKSMVPVHVNGHFLVDDSRKNLEKTPKEKVNWNELLSKYVIAPCYVDLLLHAKQLTERREALPQWFYRLLPCLGSKGEVASLKLPESVYSQLHHRNPEILLQTCPKSGNMKWFTITGKSIGYFFQQFVSKETNCQVKTELKLRNALVQLGLPVVTDAPDIMYDNHKNTNEQYAALVTPELIIDHLKNRVDIREMEDFKCKHFETSFGVYESLNVYP